MNAESPGKSSETTREVDRPGFCFGDDCFPREAVRSSQITDHREGRHQFNTALG